MLGEWPESSLEDLCDLIVDCPHSTPEWTDSGVVVLRNQYIRGGRLDLSNPSYTTEEGYLARIKRAIPLAGDLVLTREAPMGEVCQIPEGLKCCLGQRMVLLRPAPEKVDSEFLLFSLQSPYLQHQINWSEGTGTTVSNIRLPDLRAFKVPVPSLRVQKAIAGILKALDDKIELNRQINATLESMAQAMFKSWFVDFDPVIDNALAAGNPIPEPLQARADKRAALLAAASAADTFSASATDNAHPTQTAPHTQPGTTAPATPLQPLPADLRALFPNSFVFNEEMGWVPEGWIDAKVGDYLDVLETGRRPKGGVAKYSEGVPSVGAESIGGIGGFDFGKTKYVPFEFFETMKSGRVEDYDVLLYKDGGKPGDFKPRIGMYGEGYPFSEFGINEHVFRLRSESLGQPFLYYQVGSDRSFHDLAVRGGKAAIPGVNQGDVKSLLLIVPDFSLVERFNATVQPWFKSILLRSKQSRTLEDVRDLLLPKLLSGQLQLTEAEQMVAEAL